MQVCIYVMQAKIYTNTDDVNLNTVFIIQTYILTTEMFLFIIFENQRNGIVKKKKKKKKHEQHSPPR